LLTIINILLIIDLNRKIQSSASSSIRNTRISKNQRAINITLIIMTLLFILLTGPNAVCSMLFSQIMKLPNGELIIILLDCITFSYHALNILVLCLSNKEFLRQLKKSFGFTVVDFESTLRN
jgi:hypothetical protein